MNARRFFTKSSKTLKKDQYIRLNNKKINFNDELKKSGNF